ncbi:MAG TPA: cupin domain-containing protein, partial [Reyranella sp.]
SHPTTEAVTVLSGKLLLGMGDKLDPKKGTVLTAGGYAEAPAKMNHYAVATSPSVIQVHGMGPFDITYVDKADDPRTAAPR